MNRLGLTLAAMGLGVASAAGSLATGTPALADGGSHHVYRTDGDGVWLHSVPSILDGLITVLPDGTEFIPDCYALSESVLGNPVWLYGRAGTLVGYATDYYIDTHWSTVSDLEVQGIPACGVSATAVEAPVEVAAPPLARVSIQPLVNGSREQNLAAFTNQLQTAADAAGVSGQELARVIHHEGGNYLGSTWRENPVQNFEMMLPIADSVGIGQVTVPTAREVDAAVYGTDDSAYSDGVIKSWLIYDPDYAFRAAAGKLRMLQDAGLGDGWPQFMGYSLPIDLAVAWKSMGHPMDNYSLTSLGMNVAEFQARQQYYNDTVNAIG